MHQAAHASRSCSAGVPGRRLSSRWDQQAYAQDLQFLCAARLHCAFMAVAVAAGMTAAILAAAAAEAGHSLTLAQRQARLHRVP